ncbi:NlpC/P60 family protein [Asticcacaulis sp.]|uniref:NlpC/P60 family protein n=1 Tax=Asticcacaulis sp. TaxID=1872648 RepID=UPI002C900AAB|nr:NlpC/P60 family protein [Asticcacaulis sp.]HTM79684.1 NlpC/P60 family protein [Asticcacaulis sp.]
MIIEEARIWIGTPYQHQASLKGVGCDCIGLVRGVWRALYGAEPCHLPAYSPDWAEVGGEDRLIAGLGAHFEPVDEARAGDVLVFRMKPGAVAKHVAILSAGEGLGDPAAKIIHAYWGHAVVESWLGPFWRKCVVAGYRFPEMPPSVADKRRHLPRFTGEEKK